MFQNSIILLLTGFILLLPLAFWMYIFVSFFEYGISRKQFFFGIIAGGVTGLPLIYRDAFYLGNILENIFLNLSLDFTQVFSFSLLFYLLIYFSIIWFFWGILGYFFQDNNTKYLKIQILSFGAFISLLIGAVFYIDLLHYFLIQVVSGVRIIFGDLVFLSVGSIIGYYIITSLLEEGMKYISALGFSGKGEYFRVFHVYISMSACIALGFAFFENIIYISSYISQSGLSWTVLQIIFFRSIFSIILHLIASMLFAMAFWYIFKYFRISKFIILSFLAIGSHILFNVSLSFGYPAVMLIYIMFIYLLLSYLSVRYESISSVGLELE